MHYYQFNIGDYAAATRHLSPIEDIAYRRLLDLAYTTEAPISHDIRQVSRQINLREYQQEVEDVLMEFFESVEEGWIHNRVLKEIEATGGKSEKAKQSAKVRWDKVRNAKAMREECECNANASKNHANASLSDATQDPRPITQDQLPKEKQPNTRKRGSAILIQEFLKRCDEKGERRIPESDPVFDTAEQIGITLDMVKVCWQEFVRSHSESEKKQTDWRATFRNYVRKNYYKLWYVEADGSVKETPQYRALKKVEEVHAQR